MPPIRQIALMAALAWLLAESTHADPPWYERHLIGMEVGPTGAQWGSDPRDTGYAAAFSGTEIVAKQIEIGSEYLVLWGRDGEWAYYNSTLMPKAPGLGDRDPLREAVDAAKPHGLPLIVYCVVQSSGHALRAHPEFAMVGPDRKPIPNRVCLNGPYRDFIKGLLTEMLAYDIDGFHVDMVDQGFGPPYGCYCAQCDARFKQRYHQEMPGVTWDAAWDKMLEFRYDTSADFERDLRAFVRDAAPSVTVDYNYHGYPPFSFEVGQRPVQHAHIGDFVTCESGPWAFGTLGSGLTAEFVRASAPGRRYQVVMQRGVRMYHDQTCRPLNDLRWEMFSLLAHGAQVTIVDKTPFSGALDPVAYGRIHRIFDEVHAKRAHFGQAPVYEAGIYYSHRARDWYGREQQDKYQHAFFGAHKALSYAHIPAGVVLDESVTPGRLAEFPVVVLPNVTILSDAEVGALTAYVQGGGHLVVTGQTGCYDAFGAPREDSVLEDLIGARLVRLVPDADAYLRLGPLPGELAALARDVPLDWPHLVYGPAAVYEPAGAEAHGELVAPVRRQRQLEGKEGTTFPSSANAPIGPGVLVHRVGSGRVLTFAVAPGAAAGSEYRTAEARNLLSNAVSALRGTPRIAIDAPHFVETTVSDDPETRTLRVHLIGYPAPPGITEAKRPWILPALIEDAPLYRARITLDRPVAGATAFNDSTQVDVAGPEVRLLVDDIHDVVSIRYE
jgi:hypothetical protein